jgi:hypothetical protein
MESEPVSGLCFVAKMTELSGNRKGIVRHVEYAEKKTLVFKSFYGKRFEKSGKMW